MIAKINFLNCFQLQITVRTNYEKINVLKFQNGKLIVKDVVHSCDGVHSWDPVKKST